MLFSLKGFTIIIILYSKILIFFNWKMSLTDKNQLGFCYYWFYGHNQNPVKHQRWSFGWFLNTSKGFIALYLMLEHLKYFLNDFFFYLGFLTQPFTNHRTAGEGGGHFFNSSVPLPPTSKTLRH